MSLLEEGHINGMKNEMILNEVPRPDDKKIFLDNLKICFELIKSYFHQLRSSTHEK